MAPRTLRFAGGGGMASVILILVSLFAIPGVAADDPMDKIRALLVDHRAGILLGLVSVLVAVPLLVWFAIALREAIGGDRIAAALGTASLVGVAVAGTLWIAGQAVLASGVYVNGTGAKLGVDATRIVFETFTLMWGCSLAGLALFTLTASLAIRRTSALPGYTVWLGFIAAAANIVGLSHIVAPGVGVLGLLGGLTFLIFVFAAGVALARTPVSPQSV